MTGDRPPRYTPTSEAEEQLAELQFHFGSAYDIRVIDGVWLAARRDGIMPPLEAVTADELWEAIRADYAARPVSRNDAPGDEL